MLRCLGSGRDAEEACGEMEDTWKVPVLVLNEVYSIPPSHNGALRDGPFMQPNLGHRIVERWVGFCVGLPAIGNPCEIMHRMRAAVWHHAEAERLSVSGRDGQSVDGCRG